MFVGREYLVYCCGFIVSVESRRSFVLLEFDSVCGVQMSSYIFGFKYNTSVDNTTLYLYTKIVYFVRATGFDLIRSSSGPPRRRIQELFMFHCTVGSQKLISFCYRN